MSLFEKFRESWVRPALFFGNNPISLAGGAITSASGVTMIGYWLEELFGHPNANPYLGIIFFLILPALFIFGLALIPVGVFLRRRKLMKAGEIPVEFPKVDLNDRIFRHGIDIVLVATIVNLLVVATASYRGASYMDSPQFCGQSCHVMHPEYTAYRISAHSHVACVECHIGSGASSYFEAKINGTKQLIEVTFHPIAHLAPRIIPDYPRPIPSPVTSLRPARDICEGCHTPTRFDGDKLLVKSEFADDEANTESQTVLVMHLGGVDALSRYVGIHGVHLGHIEYIATDPTRTTIPWVQRTNPDGSKSTFVASALKGAMPQGERRVMDCIDCHNRAAHTFVTAEEAINQAMAAGSISPNLPWVHKEGLSLLKASYASQEEAGEKIPAQLEAFYRATNPAVLSNKAALVKSAGDELVTLYDQNVFPYMNVTWGTHPNNIGHMSYPGCFRCHDGDHVSKDGTTLTQDCSVCHNLLAVEEAKPKVLGDLGIQ
ncbi:MAG TPA: NapC/NirT family cytochrome c [Terracidiphilus sp.]|nr:NapC/NirT family cytochrome c [Terracidiphilus sp.]